MNISLGCLRSAGQGSGDRGIIRTVLMEDKMDLLMDASKGKEGGVRFGTTGMRSRRLCRRRKKRLCILGNYVSIESKQMEKRMSYLHHCSIDHLKCSLCGRKSCRNCLLRLHGKLEEFHILNDRWCHDVDNYITNNIIPTTFEGSCCEYKSELRKPRPLKADTPHDQCQNVRGHLHLPEYGLLLTSPFGSIDAHIFAGDSKNGINGVYHSVVKDEFVNLVPTGNMSELLEHVDCYSINLKTIYDKLGDKIGSFGKVLFVVVSCFNHLLIIMFNYFYFVVHRDVQ